MDYDVAIIGAGPAGLSLAALLAAAPNPPRVAVLAAGADARWVPNYGVWTEEWAALDAAYGAGGVPGLRATGTDTEWADTDCFFGEGPDGAVGGPGAEGHARRTLGRAYVRVSRVGLKSVFFGSGGGERGYEVCLCLRWGRSHGSEWCGGRTSKPFACLRAQRCPEASRCCLISYILTSASTLVSLLASACRARPR